jgi:hypothetical protein
VGGSSDHQLLHCTRRGLPTGIMVAERRALRVLVRQGRGSFDQLTEVVISLDCSLREKDGRLGLGWKGLWFYRASMCACFVSFVYRYIYCYVHFQRVLPSRAPVSLPPSRAPISDDIYSVQALGSATCGWELESTRAGRYYRRR